MAGQLFVGTSGFAYDAWKHGVFYPEGIRNDQMLEHYSSVLSSVEIIYTFRHFPAESTMAAWRQQARPGFRMALRAPMRITHTRRLAGVGGEVARFVERAAILADNLGPVLFQTPPELEYDEQLLAGFADVLPPGLATVMEFRNDSWAAAGALLEQRGVAVCLADTDDGPAAPPNPPGPFAYLRLRRTEYSEGDLAAWAERVSAVLRDGRDVYCYFRHEDTGTGPRWALRLRQLVDERNNGI